MQRLLKPAIPTQGIVNIGSWPLHPTAQNFVLQAHMLEVLLFRGLRSWRAASAVSPEPVRNQRTQKCLPVKWCSACGCAATGSLTFQVQKCVQHSADSTELSTCCLLVTSLHLFVLCSIQDPPIKGGTEKVPTSLSLSHQQRSETVWV